MALSIRFTGAADGDDGPFSLASANGWRLFAEWVESLPPVRSGRLRELTNGGRCDDTAELAVELGWMLKEHPPTSDDVRHTGEGLLDSIGVGSGEEAALVTDE